MTYFHWVAGISLALIWLSRMVDAARGMRTIANISQSKWDCAPDSAANHVTIIVPARDEEREIQQALRRLISLDYENYDVVAVDDRSTDSTGEIMDSVSAESPEKLKVIHVCELPPKWMGKTHAMWTAAKQSKGDWLLFTDADVMFRKDTLRRAITYAEAERADHLVIFPKIIMKSASEKMMIAFFQLLFVFGHRPWKVADPKAKDHMGVGAFNLLRRSAYEAVGTYERLRMEVVDDMKLGKVIKNAGFRQRVVFGDDLIEIRWARGARGVVNNLTKNFFAVMSFQTWRALLSSAALAYVNLLPFLGVVIAPGWSRIPYAIALGSMFCLYAGIWGQAEISPWYFFMHPLSSTLFIYTLMRSTFLTLWKGGVEWRGTRYPLEDLRKGLV